MLKERLSAPGVRARLDGLTALFAHLFTREKGRRHQGRKDGVFVRRFPSGRIMTEAQYRDGVKHGPHTAWFRDGRLAARWHFEAGRPHGRVEVWHRRAGKAIFGEYLEGAKTGEWFYIRPDGRLDVRRTGVYDRGFRFAGIRGFNDWNFGG